MTYQQALDFLYGSLPMYQKVGGKAFNKDLTRTIRLCEALGNPQHDFPSVHISGTNGKGTSAHTIAAIAQSAGYKTGLYTSPHLKSFNERVRINGQPLDDASVVAFVEQNQALLKEVGPSFFEMTVALAYQVFSEQKVDLAIVEVGMGGRLDSTNIITPLVSLITTIGLDHQQFLGDTIEAISREKGGIIKPGVPLVIGTNQSSVQQELAEIAKTQEATVHNTNGHKTVGTESEGYDLLDDNDQSILTGFKTSITGHYFLRNVPGIVETIHTLRQQGYKIDNDHIRTGLENIQSLTGLKGRWQVLHQEPLTICDIGHNIDGITAIVQQINQTPHRQLHFVFGTVSDKKLDDILPLLPGDAHYYFCQPDIPRALPAAELSAIAGAHGLQGPVIKDVNEAIKAAMQEASVDDLVFIGGSTFVVAEIDGL